MKPHASAAISPTTPAAALTLARLLDDHELGDRKGRRWRIKVVSLRPVRQRAGWRHVTIAIAGAGAPPSASPLMTGILSGGGRGVQPWCECRLYPEVRMADGALLDARAAGLEAAIVDRLGEIIAPGGHLMAEYESPGQERTHAELLLRVPPAASALGAMMFHAGFNGAFKDWYIAEGGHEGPRKLQANKPPHPAAARAAMRTHARELAAFVRRRLPEDAQAAAIVRAAQARARKMLGAIRRRSRQGRT